MSQKFEAKLSSAGLFKDAIGVIHELITEDVTFKLTREGLQLTAMDPANVSMIVFKMLSPAFESYALDQEQTIGIDLDRLYQVLRQASAADALTIRVDDGQLKLFFKGTSTRRFSLPLLETPAEGKKVPNLTFEAHAVFDSSVLAEGIANSEIISDSIVITADGKNLTLTAAGDLGQFEQTIAAGEPAIKELHAPQPTRARYAVDYLKKMIKAGKLSPTVKLQFKTNFPLQLDYTITDTLQLSFILAPRIETE